MATAYMPPTTMSGLRDYVAGSSSMQQSAQSTVQLFVTHCHLQAKFPEIRLDKHVRGVDWGGAPSVPACTDAPHVMSEAKHTLARARMRVGVARR
jgi:hypothetical protein